MASITLKNIPEPLHFAYKRRAKAHSRSLQAEILRTLTLAQNLADPEAPDSLTIAEVAGILKPKRKGVSIRDMDDAINRSLHDSWK